MGRTRRAPRPELTESWDDMYGSNELLNDEDEEERTEMEEEYRQLRTTGSRASRDDAPRRRNLRSSVEPELVMPSSPDAASARKRSSAPRLRQSDRSTTSDAGYIRKQTRANTPHFRMADRSLTSDAGRFRPSRLSNMADTEDDDGSIGSNAPGFIWRNAVSPLLAYTLDVMALVLRSLKPVLSWMVLLYLVLAALVFGSGFLTDTVNNALSPICRLPFTSHLPFCPARSSQGLQGPAEFDKLMQAQDAFQDILASTSMSINLPFSMKRSEASIRDLKNVVQYSTLPSRNELVFEFSGFIETARQASYDLGKFNSRIGKAVDQILSTNRWTLNVIDGVSNQEALRGTIPQWASRNLNIFAPFQPLSLSQDALLDQYLRHTGAVEEQILSLIQDAYALRDVLDNLDGRLDIIAGIAARDGVKTEANKDELLANLWSKVGGNRATLSKLNQQIDLLGDVTRYRKVAWAQVTNTLLKLQAIQHSLEDLRERVAQPETIGTDRVPLEVHIASINLGIERLERQRDSGREIEAANHRRVLDRADDPERRLAVGGGEL